MTTAPSSIAALTTRVSSRDRGFGSFGAVLAVLALAVLAPVGGTSGFAFSLPNAAVALGTIALPTTSTVVVLALAALGVSGTQAVRGTDGHEVRYLGLSVALFMVAFLAWAASGETVNVVSLLRATVRSATPLALGALAGVLCEKSGVINIAIEGQLLVGAFAAAVIGSVAGPWGGLVGAMLAALAIGMLLAVFSIRFRADQIIVGVVLVVFGGGLTAFLVRQLPGSLNQPRRFSAVGIPGLADLPVLGPLFFGQTVIVYLMLLAVGGVTWVLFQTRWGLRVRAVGEKPAAADTVGIDVERIRYQAVALGSLIAGIGGAYYTLDSSGQFSRDMTNGAGFIALAAVLVGAHHPVGAFGAALVFGFAEALATSVSILGVPISSNLLQTAPYVATIFVVAGVVGRIRVPAAGGQPYTKE